MYLLVGLGNPGKEYDNTRHNIGFTTIDVFAERYNVKISQSKFNGLYASVNINNQKVILLKPQSYINLSGEVIRKYLDFFKIPIENLLVINDDLDLEFGVFKLKADGSSGGHNGLKNIELHLGTKKYKRLKIGISKDKSIDIKDYVLGKLSTADQEEYKKMGVTIQKLLDDYFVYDFDKLMNLYNRKKLGDQL